MEINDLSMWLLGAGLIIHTLCEVWIPLYQKVKPDWQSVVFDRVQFLDNLPVFIFSIGVAIAGWQLPIIGGILPAVSLTHPLLDHLALSWRYQKLRPGSFTGLLLIPLSLWVYYLGYTKQLISLSEFLISGLIGLGISIWLLSITIPELEKQNQTTDLSGNS